MDDRIIDIGRWMEGGRPKERGTTFAIWGGEGERSRFALPVWRSIYLLGGERGGLVRLEADGRTEPLFVLDLAAEPARTEFGREVMDDLEEREPPAVSLREGAAGVLLDRGPDRAWFLLVAGEEVCAVEPDARSREDLLFLAGECAGLLRYRGLAAEE